MKNIYCIVGPSGVGKTTLVNELVTRNPSLKAVESYTDRPERYAGETGHVFLSEDMFTRLKASKGMVAYTEFCGHRYGVTADMVDECDLYVIDPAGVKTLKRLYHGRRGIRVIGLVADSYVLIARMRLRGDSEENIIRRLEHDEEAFANMREVCDYVHDLSYDGATAAARVLESFILAEEQTTPNVVIHQINTEYDMDRVCFRGYDSLARLQKTDHPEINLSIYDETWSGSLDDTSLDAIFALFNSDDRPNRKTMRSLSVSDIVEIRHDEDESRNGMWFCDSVGWRKVVTKTMFE